MTHGHVDVLNQVFTVGGPHVFAMCLGSRWRCDMALVGLCCMHGDHSLHSMQANLFTMWPCRMHADPSLLPLANALCRLVLFAPTGCPMQPGPCRHH